MKDRRYRTGRRPRDGRLLESEDRAQLAGAPLGMLLAQRTDAGDDLSGHSMRRSMRCAGEVGESLSTAFHVALSPFVAGFLADAILPAEVTKRHPVAGCIRDELESKGHDR